MSRYTFPHAGDCKASEKANKAREKATVEFEPDEELLDQVNDDLGDPEVRLS